MKHELEHIHSMSFFFTLVLLYNGKIVQYTVALHDQVVSMYVASTVQYPFSAYNIEKAGVAWGRGRGYHIKYVPLSSNPNDYCPLLPCRWGEEGFQGLTL